jgi:hypothetical protein
LAGVVVRMGLRPGEYGPYGWFCCKDGFEIRGIWAVWLELTPQTLKVKDL